MGNKLRAGLGYALFLAVGLGLGSAAVRVPAWFKPAYQTGDYAAFYPDKQVRVAVYGTPWCPYCQKTRSYLKAHQIAFADVNIEASPLQAARFRQLGGDGAVPVVLIGDRRINGFVPEQFEAALAHLH